MSAELIECKTTFSNGSEYMWFIENFCDACARFRNGRCRTYAAIEKARWDEKYFPYGDLMDYELYAGKACKRFTKEKPNVVRHRKQLKGQTRMEIP